MSTSLPEPEQENLEPAQRPSQQHQTGQPSAVPGRQDQESAREGRVSARWPSVAIAPLRLPLLALVLVLERMLWPPPPLLLVVVAMLLLLLLLQLLP